MYICIYIYVYYAFIASIYICMKLRLRLTWNLNCSGPKPPMPGAEVSILQQLLALLVVVRDLSKSKALKRVATPQKNMGWFLNLAG